MKRVILFLFVVFAFMVSCDEKEGERPFSPMEWESNVPYDENFCFDVPAEGGRYELVCTNFNKIYISLVREKDTVHTSSMFFADSTFVRDWYSICVKYVNQGRDTMIVNVERNDVDTSRYFKVVNTAPYSYGTTFTFNQRAKK